MYVPCTYVVAKPTTYFICVIKTITRKGKRLSSDLNRPGNSNKMHKFMRVTSSPKLNQKHPNIQRSLTLTKKPLHNQSLLPHDFCAHVKRRVGPIVKIHRMDP